MAPCAFRSVVRSVGVSSVGDVQDCDSSVVLVDAVDDPVGAPSGAVTAIERGLEPLAESLWVVQECPDDEFVRGEGDRFWEVLR